ncbi:MULTISPECIES: hypothetical protein [unclassified Ruminococcus]|uniref:hypothetical protein n=1 Tax=unclassified Ruminococcus TaxID=2608920 RepID=UPI00210DD90A|nr:MULTISPECIES: hypothetical protein [unclassified Ruminococcus]MCQ4021528.1 hypothetical protein [Ruminococcus sp. zg-924]MCQ4113973.1 hypothetical protein [Ruminococcus sp. zg-921]
MDSFIVYLRFLTLCGLSEDEGDKYRFLCKDSIRYFKSRAKSEKVLCEQGSSFNAAAAALAALNYERLKLGDAADSLKAGDVTISLNSKSALDSAKAYYNTMLEDVRPYLSDSDFSFEAV